MKYFILAAGEGSRLRTEGITTPKPLLQIGNESLIERQFRLAQTHGFSEVCVIVNELYPTLKTFITSKSFDIPMHIVVKTTPSSFHSFCELRQFFTNESCMLTTVDPFYDEARLDSYLQFASENQEYDGVMAVTTFVDDEKPLWATTNHRMEITRYSSLKQGAKFVSAGFYIFRPTVLPVIELGIQNNTHKMRVFQQSLLDQGKRLIGFDMGKVIDIDHISDISQATDFLLK